MTLVTTWRANADQIGWMPFEFRHVLHGKNHLNARKFNLNIFRQEGGPLGKGAYRKHFFGDASLHRVASFLFREKTKYTTASLNIKRRINLG